MRHELRLVKVNTSALELLYDAPVLRGLCILQHLPVAHGSNGAVKQKLHPGLTSTQIFIAFDTKIVRRQSRVRKLTLRIRGAGMANGI